MSPPEINGSETDTSEDVSSEDTPAQSPTGVLVRIEVSETGIRVDADMAARLFEPFVQASSSTMRQYGGNWLGLTICRHLANLMGGAVGVESEIDQGSTFWFSARLERAPRDEAVVHAEATSPSQGAVAVSADVQAEAAFMAETAGPASTPRPASPAAPSLTRAPAARAAERTGPPGSPTMLPPAREPRNTLPILVVEDSPMNQLTVLSMLDHLGYRGQAVGNGHLAVEAVQAGGYAAVLMDCQMPIMDGFEATVAIRSYETEQEEAGQAAGDQLAVNAARVPVIAMTAGVMLTDRERCLAAGMDDYVRKPLEPAALEAALERWVGRGASQEQPITADGRPTALSLRAAGASAPASPLEVHLNLAHLGSLARVRTPDGATLVDRMIGYFVEAAPKHIGRIRRAVADGQVAPLAQVAHKLTGESATVGALEVGRLAREIELLALADALPAEAEHVEALVAAVDAATAALRQYQARMAASSAA